MMKQKNQERRESQKPSANTVQEGGSIKSDFQADSSTVINTQK